MAASSQTVSQFKTPAQFTVVTFDPSACRRVGAEAGYFKACYFKASLVYTLSSRLARATECLFGPEHPKVGSAQLY